MPQHPPASLLLAAFLFALGTGACADHPAGNSATPAAAEAGCLTTGDGNLEARLRGAIVADLAWKNSQMQCEGGVRPGGDGIRVTIAGPLPDGKQLRFIFGIDPHDTASGVAQALPTNLTVIMEGGQQLYATRGDDKCAIESLQRIPVPGSNGRLDRVRARGYCIGPASDLAGATRLLIPTFSFTALMSNGEDP
jgi:hypothetical protein